MPARTRASASSTKRWSSRTASACARSRSPTCRRTRTVTSLAAEETFDPPTTPLDANGQGEPYAVYGFGAHLAEVEVDCDLGTTQVLKIVAAHDVGRAINPTLVEGQIEGGVAQGLGLALMEEFFPGRGENLHDYLIPIDRRHAAGRLHPRSRRPRPSGPSAPRASASRR